MLKRLTRRKLLAAAGSVVAAANVAGSAEGADASWPSKPIRVLMPFGAVAAACPDRIGIVGAANRCRESSGRYRHVDNGGGSSGPS